ncbi:hypothetical protein SCARD494_00110 [Seiridium cardinale]
MQSRRQFFEEYISQQFLSSDRNRIVGERADPALPQFTGSTIAILLLASLLAPLFLRLPSVIAALSAWLPPLKNAMPACVIHSAASLEVATIVRIPNKYPDGNFSAKGGGHDLNHGHGSIEDDVLIAWENLRGTWNDVRGKLEPNNVTIVGGRLDIVGVGGYLLQGGISFLSAQYGLAADNIVGWETVAANGPVFNIDASTRPNLAIAVRDSSRDALIAAFHDFVPNAVNDPKPAVMFTNVLAMGGLPVIIVYYFYDSLTAHTAGALAEFLEIPALINQTSV